MLSSTRAGHVEGFGRVLVANKAFLVGDEVLREAPLLSWPSENWAVYVDALCAAGEATRAAVLDLFHPPLDSGLPVVAGLRAIAVRLAGEERPEFCDVDFVHTALLVAELNAHACDNGARKAMFQQASKAAHSCAPNAAYSSRDVPGHLVYKAIKPIAAGEQITVRATDMCARTRRVPRSFH
jgi:SET domain